MQWSPGADLNVGSCASNPVCVPDEEEGGFKYITGTGLGSIPLSTLEPGSAPQLVRTRLYWTSDPGAAWTAAPVACTATPGQGLTPVDGGLRVLITGMAGAALYTVP